ncbi:MAG: hypothetical protein WCH31_08815 [Actinomycetes bacterium]
MAGSRLARFPGTRRWTILGRAVLLAGGLLSGLAFAGGSASGSGGVDLTRHTPCEAGQQPTPTRPCKPSSKTKEDLDPFPYCQGTQEPTPANPCDPTDATGQFDIAKFTPREKGQTPTQNVPCRPGETTPINLTSFPPCASGQQPTTDCR